MKVKQMMHKGVQWVSPDTPVTTLAKKMKKYDVGALPVGENDRLVGMVTDRDIAIRGVANTKNVSKLTARDIMTKGIIGCRASSSTDEAARLALWRASAFGGFRSSMRIKEWSACSASATSPMLHHSELPRK